MVFFLGRPLDYRACGHHELRKFVKDRTKKDIAKDIGKEQLVMELEALGQAVTFPFEKLPSELRLQIYEDLVFHPQILRVSKLIYKEAKPVLDKQESVTRLVVEHHHLGDTIRVDDGPVIPLPDPQYRFSTIATHMASWPQILLSARHIRIHFKGHAGNYWALYQLASIIGDIPVEIGIYVPEVIVNSWQFHHENRQPPPYLWPVARMGPHAEISLHGVYGTTVEKSMQRDFAVNRSTRTLLYQYLQVIDELEDTLKLAKQAGIPAFFVYSLCQMARHAQFSGARGSLFAAEEGSMHGLFEKVKYNMEQNPEYARMRGEALSILADRLAQIAKEDVDKN